MAPPTVAPSFLCVAENRSQTGLALTSRPIPVTVGHRFSRRFRTNVHPTPLHSVHAGHISILLGLKTHDLEGWSYSSTTWRGSANFRSAPLLVIASGSSKGLSDRSADALAVALASLEHFVTAAENHLRRHVVTDGEPAIWETEPAMIPRSLYEELTLGALNCYTPGSGEAWFSIDFVPPGDGLCWSVYFSRDGSLIGHQPR